MLVYNMRRDFQLEKKTIQIPEAKNNTKEGNNANTFLRSYKEDPGYVQQEPKGNSQDMKWVIEVMCVETAVNS